MKCLHAQIVAVLYPGDATEEGKLLRLKQQFFLCSASLQVYSLCLFLFSLWHFWYIDKIIPTELPGHHRQI